MLLCWSWRWRFCFFVLFFFFFCSLFFLFLLIPSPRIIKVSDSGILGTVATLSASQIGEDSLLQIYADGIRHIRADGRVNEWKAPPKRAITHCAVNARQVRRSCVWWTDCLFIICVCWLFYPVKVAIALLGGEIVYFETDGSGQLNEYTERMQMPGLLEIFMLWPPC